jgi:hypothetical protein
MSRRSAAAEPLLKRSCDLAERLHDPEILAASGNDLGNLYAAPKRPTETASAYREAIRNAEAARDEALAATAEINAARLALGNGDTVSAIPLLSASSRPARTVATLLQPRNGTDFRGIGRV